MANTALNRSGVVLLTNKSGGSVAQGDVVVVSTGTANSFTTTTSSGYSSGAVGVVLEPNGIANDAVGIVALSGYVPVINLSSSAGLGELIKTHSVAKQGVPHAAPAVTGDFAQALATGTTPAALLLGTTFAIASGSADFPKRATMWHNESLVTAGNGITQTLNTSQPYNVLYYQNTAANGDTFTQSFMMRAGTFTLYVLGVTSNDRGKIDWYVDDVLQISGQDWYSASATFNVTKSGSITVVGDGLHVLKGVVNGKSGSSSNYYISPTKMWIVPAAD